MAVIGRQALTVLLPVRAGRQASLTAALENAGPALAERLQAAKTLHFARLVLVPGDEADGRVHPACLLFETTYDGELAPHVTELFALAGAELAPLLAECEGETRGGGLAAFDATLRRGARTPRAFAAPSGNLGVTEIRRDAMLRERLLELLGRERASLGVKTPLEVLVAVRLALGLVSARPEGQARRVELPAADPPWTLVAAIPLVLAMLVHDVRERLLGLWHDRTDALRLPALARARARSQRAVQHAFTHVALAKPGRFRRGALRRVLALVGSLLAGGELARSLPGLHGLRFVLLDDGRLLFTNQQDGSLSSRLMAFGRRTRMVLALVWSSTQGFPQSLLAHLCGKTDDDGVLEWLRERELPGFAYSAYPGLTVRDLAVNAEVRALLTAEPTDATARRLLAIV